MNSSSASASTSNSSSSSIPTSGTLPLPVPPVSETPDMYGAYPRLTDNQIAALAAGGVPRQVKVGDVLYREGEGDCDFCVIFEGKVALIEDSGAGEQMIGIHGPRRFLGELGLISGQPVLVSAVVVEPRAGL